MPKRQNNIKSLYDRRPRIYLAGPDVFLRNAIQVGQRKKALCEAYGFEGIFPIDAELSVQNYTPRDAGLTISALNEDLIRKCDLIIANITPFRGPSADVGTAYEMGFGHGIGLRIFAYTNVKIPFTERIKLEFKNSIKMDENRRLIDMNNMAIEEWGLVDNLMLEGCIYSSGGRLVVEDAPKKEIFTYLGAFEKCLILARDIILRKQESHQR